MAYLRRKKPTKTEALLREIYEHLEIKLKRPPTFDEVQQEYKQRYGTD